MPQYKYVAKNKLDEKKNGYAVAQNEEELAVILASQGLYLISSKLYTGNTPSSFFTMGTGKVKRAELTAFSRQLATMLNAGITLLASIEVLKDQNYTPFFKRILLIVYDDVKGGMMLSDAFEKHKKAFPEFFLSMLKIGEKSGKLDSVMGSIANYYEKDSELKRKIKSAFAYPVFLLVLMSAIAILMMVYIVPTFRDSLSNLDVPIEGITAVIYNISDFVLLYWKEMLLGILVFVLLLFLLGKTKDGRYFYDYIKVHIPGFKKLNIEIVSSRFARGFELLISSGMDVNEALDSVVILLGNKDIEKRFKLATEDIRHGISLAMAFEKYKLFPTMMLQMISIGEKTASLDDALRRSSKLYDEIVETSTASLVSKIQPIIIAILGAVIGVMFIGVYSPMLSIMQNLI